MSAVTRHGVVLLLVLAGATSVRGVEFELTPRALTDALDIGQSRLESVRRAFHGPYRIPVARPPVDTIEVVTPFRRVVSAAEARLRIGDRLYGQREARATLTAAPAQMDVVVELTFHPLNAYVGVPAYEVILEFAGPAPRVLIRARSLERVPRFGARVDGVLALPIPAPASPRGPAASQPLTGGTVVAVFDTRVLAPAGRYDAVVLEMGKELVRAPIDLSALR